MEADACAGEPFEIKKAVCLHEEDAGVIWKHTELRTMHPESRRGRRLVISTMATVGAAQSPAVHPPEAVRLCWQSMCTQKLTVAMTLLSQR